MNCPKCHSAMREQLFNDSIAYGACGKCHGRWVSGESLALNSASFCDGEDKVFKHFMQMPVKTTSIQCPDCKLKNLTLVNVNQIEVEFCTGCQGVFFDLGEMPQAMPKEGLGRAEEGVMDDVESEGFFRYLSDIFDF